MHLRQGVIDQHDSFNPPQGAGEYPNLSTPHQAGTSPLECWYSGVTNQTAYSTGAIPAINTIRAYPVVIGRSGFIDRIAFEITATAVAAVARVGIYRDTSKYNCYPSSLVVDGGEFDCSSSTGTKVATISTFLQAGRYWFVSTSGVLAPTFRIMAVGALSPMLGIPSTMGASANGTLSSNTAYAALPATFPAGAGTSSNIAALVHIRWAT